MRASYCELRPDSAPAHHYIRNASASPERSARHDGAACSCGRGAGARRERCERGAGAATHVCRGRGFAADSPTLAHLPTLSSILSLCSLNLYAVHATLIVRRGYARHWHTLAARWLHAGGTLAARWLHAGCTLAARWLHAGCTLAARWRHAGGTLVPPHVFLEVPCRSERGAGLGPRVAGTQQLYLLIEAMSGSLQLINILRQLLTQNYSC
ncbi:hypothetical protein B5X24_HaOG206137 [Helicoverpa armigera]|uniref:Uncharacterized protein n=1 Tax=Helicoverpa armigera TaxID=29058 RepID=A0A2W1BQM0_HELAM|nr:hypothetical protein B5X24_HaOG206137 [Helicoverpa armigera]